MFPGKTSNLRRALVGQRRPTRRSLAAGALALLALLAVDAQAVSQEKHDLRFTSRPSRVEVSADGREVLVEFPGELKAGEADRASHELGTLLEGYSEGYGAVRFRLTLPSRASFGKDGRTVEVMPKAELVPNVEDERRLALLEARTEAANGDVAGARVRLQQIEAQRPSDMEPKLALVDVETGAARWRQALGLYDGVLRLYPEATDVIRDRETLAIGHAPTVRLDTGATFGPSGERAQTVTLGGDMPVGETWRVGVSLQTTHDEIRGLRRSGSAIGADYSGTKELGGVTLSHDWQSPLLTTRVGLLAAPQTFGASLQQNFTTRLGQTTVGGLYHQPYWGTVMAFAANARRDQAGFAQTVRLPDQWQVQLGAGVIRYGVPDHDNVAFGPTVLAGVSRGLPARWMPLAGMELRAGYRLEAEYLGQVATGPTLAGPLTLLDLRKREVHSLYAEASAPVWLGRATALLGYAIDRLGGGGPQALLRFTSGADSDRFVYSAEAGVEPSLDFNPRTLFHLGGSLVWRFGG